MNLSILTSSFRYINSSFDLVTSITYWIYEELKKINYTDVKLTRSFNINDLDITKSIIDLVNGTDTLHNLFKESIIQNRYQHVKFLIDFGIDIQANNNAFLKLACRQGNLEITKLIIDSGANVPVLLRFASYYGHTAIVKLLLKYDTNIHHNDDEALRLACVNNHYDTAELLLESGADVNADYDEPLTSAVRNRNYKLVKLLLCYGADATANEYEALQCADANNDDKMLALLQKYI